MSTAQNRFNTAITATDDTAPGIASADKRYKKLAKNTSRYAKESAGEIRRSGLGDMARTLSAVERAAARAFGSNSATARISERLSGIGQASRFAGGAMARAAAQGGTLSGALSGVALAGAGVVGVLAAAGVAGYAFVSKWANGGAQLGRLSRSINVATRDLQAFQGVAERDGVSKDAMAGALGGIGSTIHAGIYGQNPEALAALNKLGIPIKRNPDGTVDVKAMTLALADATSRIKDPYAQAHLAGIFGFQEALPTMRRGGAAIRADMGDVDRFGVMLSDADVAKATRIQRKKVIAGQWKDRVISNAEGAGAGLLESGTDEVIKAQRRFGDGAGIFDRTVTQRFVPAVDRLARSQAGSGGIGTLSARIEHQESRGRQDAVSPKGAIGAMQLMPDTARAAAARLGVPFDAHRLRTDRDYNRQLGNEELRYLMQRYGGDEMLAAAAYNAGPGAVDRWIRKYGDPRQGQISHGEFADQIPYGETRDYVHKVTPKLVHEHRFSGLPAGTTVTTRTEGAGGVAIGKAMPPGL